MNFAFPPHWTFFAWKIERSRGENPQYHRCNPMSKRKRKEGREADLVERVGKKVKTSKAESSEAHEETQQSMLPSKILEVAVSSKILAKEARRKAKRERRKTGEKSEVSVQVAVEEEVPKHNVKVVLSELKHKSKKKKKKQKPNVKLPEWKVSDAVGGSLLDLDPVFSVDEQCVGIFTCLHSLHF